MKIEIEGWEKKTERGFEEEFESKK